MDRCNYLLWLLQHVVDAYSIEPESFSAQLEHFRAWSNLTSGEELGRDKNLPPVNSLGELSQVAVSTR